MKSRRIIALAIIFWALVGLGYLAYKQWWPKDLVRMEKTASTNEYDEYKVYVDKAIGVNTHITVGANQKVEAISTNGQPFTIDLAGKNYKAQNFPTTEGYFWQVTVEPRTPNEYSPGSGEIRIKTDIEQEPVELKLKVMK